MRKQFFVKKAIAIVVFVFAFIVGLSFAVMALWNNILVDVLHVGTITFWQALGILVLSKILFGGFGRGHRGGWRNKGKWMEIKGKFAAMTPEEREKFKAEWKKKCGGRWKTQTPSAP